ncbi:MAG: hypothetical protein B6U69_00095 [Thermofilum sp. ex4484_15]|nr:MAG: hypothetical protein B6U69_00095 [Thermofilum sp. ex4484_15]
MFRRIIPLLLTLIPLVLQVPFSYVTATYLTLSYYPDPQEYPKGLGYLDLKGIKVVGKGNDVMILVIPRSQFKRGQFLWGKIELNITSTRKVIKLYFDGRVGRLSAKMIYGNSSKALRAFAYPSYLLLRLPTGSMKGLNLTDLFYRGLISLRVKFVSGIRDRMVGRIISLYNASVSKLTFEDEDVQGGALPPWCNVRKISVLASSGRKLSLRIKLSGSLPKVILSNGLIFFRQNYSLILSGLGSLNLSLYLDLMGGKLKLRCGLKASGRLEASRVIYACIRGEVIEVQVRLPVNSLSPISMEVSDAWTLCLDLLPQGYLNGLWEPPIKVITESKGSSS